MNAAVFHISLPCLQVKQTQDFYTKIIGATLGRAAQNWVDINLFENQITFIQAEKFNFNNPNYVFEGTILPSFHFGVIVNQSTWNTIYKNLNNQKIEIVKPITFLANEPGEHTSFFVTDPNGYMLEFKCFKNTQNIFSS